MEYPGPGDRVKVVDVITYAWSDPVLEHDEANYFEQFLGREGLVVRVDGWEYPILVLLDRGGQQRFRVKELEVISG